MNVSARVLSEKRIGKISLWIGIDVEIKCTISEAMPGFPPFP